MKVAVGVLLAVFLLAGIWFTDTLMSDTPGTDCVARWTADCP